jgi:amidophosphoribosyltransferase
MFYLLVWWWMLFWTKEEYQKFAEEMMDKPVSYYAFQMLYWTGIREGELLALTPADFDFERGTTLKQSIIGILDRLGPKKIVIVSSSPQVRYPDYYGIDMAKMSEFIAFKAAIELLKEREMRDVIESAYRKSKEQVSLPKEQMVNYVKEIYAPFTDEEISAKMVELLTPKGTKAQVQIVYQPLEGLHEACPRHRGDWYFSGDYPTPGGVKLLNMAFINYIEQVYQF